MLLATTKMTPCYLARVRQVWALMTAETEKRHAVSVRVVARAIGLRSPSTAHAYMQALVEAGYISYQPSQRRWRVLVPMGGYTRRISDWRSLCCSAPMLGEQFSNSGPVVGWCVHCGNATEFLDITRGGGELRKDK